MPGQGHEQVDQVVHQRPGPPVIVAEDNRIAANALGHRGHVCGPMLLAEYHQVGLPVTKDLPAFSPAISPPAQVMIQQELCQSLAAAVGEVPGVHVPLSRWHRHLRIMPEFVLDLAVHRRAVPADLNGDLRHVDVALQHAGDDAALK